MKQKFSVAIIGCGNRGAETYGVLLSERKNEFEIVALCDFNSERLKNYGARFGVPESELFLDENRFFEKKRADILVVATMDADHVRQSIRALELGYDLLLEKPVSDKKEELEALLAAQQKSGRKILVCHVLRYAPAFRKAAELIKSGAIGKLVAIQSVEQVAYWHQAHSFVRGNWRRRDETAPMILAKCCHDLDLLQYYAGSRCKSISSVGDLAHFKPENAPKGAADRCLHCSLVEECPYSAKKIYLDTFEASGRPAAIWPHIQITSAYPLTREALIEALEKGPYGRCAYACDNDVVDHQLTDIVFENGVKASLTMTAFTSAIGRIMKFFGTHGELVLNEEEDYVRLKPFGGTMENFPISELVAKESAHGGGDRGLVDSLYAMLTGEADETTSLVHSVESHLMAIAAEESRLAGGKLIEVH